MTDAGKGHYRKGETDQMSTDESHYQRSETALVLAAQALFTRFNDPRMWDKIDEDDRLTWLNLTAHVVAVWDLNCGRKADNDA